MTRPPVPVHYLRPNHAESTPRHVMFLDTETATIPDTEPQILSLRLWVLRSVDRVATDAGAQLVRQRDGRTALQLADAVEELVKGRATVWLFAHNLSFDLVTTRLPLLLASRGWEVTDAAVGGRSPWMRLRRNTKRIVLADSGSYLPLPLAEIGVRLGIPKPPLPTDLQPEETWLARCRADVDIMAAGMLQLLDWWDRNRLGRFTITGPASGWNAMRHTPATERIVIDPDPDAAKADRLAVYGGRRQVWRVGTQSLGRFLELDFVAAYPTIAAHLPLPRGRAFPVESLPLDSHMINSERWGFLGAVEVETDVPRWPVKTDHGVFYPVGQFWTQLAGPELAEAQRLGCLRQIGNGYVHQLGYSLAPWARWLLAVQHGSADDSPPAARIACKGWGRSVIGKWAARGFTKTELGPSPHLGWHYEEGYDHDRQAAGGMVDLAGRRWWVVADGPSDNAYPAVLAWVESAVRVRLSRTIEALGTGSVVQCDTDGLIAAERTIGTAAAHGHLRAPGGYSGPARTTWVLDQLDPILAPLTLRIKATHTHVHVMGPQHLEIGEQRRLAGIPRTAERTDEGTYVGRTWPKLQWQMTHGDPRGYTRPQITAHLQPSYVAGWVTVAGAVRAVTATTAEGGATTLAPWSRTAQRRPGDRLTEHQHPALANLWD